MLAHVYYEVIFFFLEVFHLANDFPFLLIKTKKNQRYYTCFPDGEMMLSHKVIYLHPYQQDTFIITSYSPKQDP